jgi:hypothetical protein
MQSYLVKYIDLLASYQSVGQHAVWTLDDIFEFLENDIIPTTDNYFDELIEIAILTKHINTYPARHFRGALKVKILQKRDIDGAELLIQKFDKE